jgi:hypothetical protein
MAKKTYNEKLNSPGELPKIEDLSGKPQSIAKFGGTKLLVAAPMQYNDVMSKIPKRKVTPTNRIREYLAEQSGADATCPLTAGIFINICANASEERDSDKIPYWRTLKAKGELNEKYPDGVDGQKMLLEMEGHTVIQKGKRCFVADYEDKLADINQL